MENLIDNVILTAVVSSKEVVISSGDASFDQGMNTEEGMYVDPGMATAKDPLLSSWLFVVGISAAVLFVSVVLGVLLAKRKIKKGIELYED